MGPATVFSGLDLIARLFGWPLLLAGADGQLGMLVLIGITLVGMLCVRLVRRLTRLTVVPAASECRRLGEDRATSAQSDPGAAGHPRPRAPSSAFQVA